MRHTIFLLLPFLLMIADTARAEWEETSWGMTMAEVRTVTYSAPRLLSAAEIVGPVQGAAGSVLAMEDSVGDGLFDVFFLIGRDGLYRIDMTARDGHQASCPDLVAEVTTRRGPAQEVDTDTLACLSESCPGTTTWSWRNLPDGSVIDIAMEVSGLPDDAPWSCTASLVKDNAPQSLLPEQ